MTFLLGLTGGIASGKSTISRYFSEKSIPVIDADIVARQVVEPGEIGLRRIVNTFGEDVLQDSGELNRKKLGQIIFNDDQKRTQLNDMLSELIRENILSQIKHYQSKNASLIVLDIPLLFEGRYDSIVDEVMVSYIPREVQLTRLMARDNLSKEDALKRINSQMSLDKKKELADVVINNTGNIDKTLQQVNAWLNKKSLT